MTKAKKKINSSQIEFLDTPGIYSISDRSEEEKITEKTLFEEEVDGAIVIADATSIGNLWLKMFLLKAGLE